MTGESPLGAEDPEATAASDPLRADYGHMLAAVSNRIVSLHKQYYGKGPTRAKTYLQRDLLVCMLRGGFTRVEETLQARGHSEAVVDQRAAFQDAVRQELVQAVEEIIGRKVVGFISGTDPAGDLMAEMFLLEAELAPPTASPDAPAAA